MPHLLGQVARAMLAATPGDWQRVAEVAERAQEQALERGRELNIVRGAYGAVSRLERDGLIAVQRGDRPRTTSIRILPEGEKLLDAWFRNGVTA